MKLECYRTDDDPFIIEPAPIRRDWMDASPQKFAYRCLPLSMANQHGWVMRSHASFEATWVDDSKEGVQIKSLDSEEAVPYISTHFGQGILTFSGRAIFRSEPSYNLWVMGMPNYFKDGIQPLTAMIETDWMPYTFTMNWKITRRDYPIRFEKGEPYCFFFLVKRGDVEITQPLIGTVDDVPEIKKQYEGAVRHRKLKQVVEDRYGTESLNSDIRWQGWYMRGEMPRKPHKPFPEHQRQLNLMPFDNLNPTSAQDEDTQNDDL